MPVLKDYDKKFRKIPIVIYPSFDVDYPGWRCEIADDYEDYKPAKYDELNFEDLGAHFNFKTVDHIDSDFPIEYGFRTKSDALKAAREIVEKIPAKHWTL